MSCQIRRATLADAAVIADFNAALAWESEGKKLDRSRLLPGVEALLQDERKGVYHVACAEGQPVGQIMFTYEWSDWRNGWFWWIQSVYVAAEHRGQGVFKALLDHLRQAASQQGDVVGLRLYVEEHNIRAQEVYAQCGFENAGYFVLERTV